MSYTPIGFVVHSTKQAAIRDLWKKIDIVELGFEMEFTDAASGELLGAATSKQGARKARGQKQDPVSWEELDAMFSTIGERTRCHIDNSRRPQAEWQVCIEILIEPEVPAES